MNFASKLNQVLTYWPPAAPDGYGGRAYGAPVLVTCRWQDKAELFRDEDGEELMSTTIVYHITPSLIVHGFVALGDLTGTPNPLTLGAAAREIMQRLSSPSLRATQELLKLWL